MLRTVVVIIVFIATAGLITACGEERRASVKPVRLTSSKDLQRVARASTTRLVRFSGVVLDTRSVPVVEYAYDEARGEPEKTAGADTTTRYVRIIPGPLIDDDGSVTPAGRAIRAWKSRDVVLVVGGPKDVEDDDAVTVVARMGDDMLLVVGTGSDYVQAEAESIRGAGEHILGPVLERTAALDDVLLGDTELQVQSFVRGPTTVRMRVRPRGRSGFCDDFDLRARPGGASKAASLAASAIERAFAGDEWGSVDFSSDGTRSIPIGTQDPSDLVWSCSADARKELADLARENAATKLSAQEQAVFDALNADVVSHPYQQVTRLR